MRADDQADRAASALRAIWVRYREEILATVDVVEAAVRDGSTGSLAEADRLRACACAHKLAGSAGTFGFPGAGEIARELEIALSRTPTVPLERLTERVLALRRELAGDPG